MRFWDTSAILPLLAREPDSKTRTDQLEQGLPMIIWHLTPVEIESALSRRRREKALDSRAEQAARERLSLIASGWMEIPPLDKIRDRAMRLVRVHPLRAADALQLAAALAACRDEPDGWEFLTGDARLRKAAGNEGFAVS